MTRALQNTQQLTLDGISHPPRRVAPLISTNSDPRQELYARWARKISINPDLSRALVSFQANKATPFFRWLKYKEAFSHEFVRHILRRFSPSNQLHRQVLDPFAGAGTTLTTAAMHGWAATGIELLPVGVAAIKAQLAAACVDLSIFDSTLDKISRGSPEIATEPWAFPHLRITRQAFARQPSPA